MSDTRMKIERNGESFFISSANGRFIVEAPEGDDSEAMASAIEEAVTGAVRRDYSPALGSVISYAATVAARILNGKVVTKAPETLGELEQQGTEE